MAGDWIRLRHDLHDDPACFALSDMCPTSMDKMSGSMSTTIGRLYLFWSWVDRHTTDGILPGVSKALIDRVCGADGFADALISVGWLHATDTGLEVPEFTRHNSNSAKARGLEAEAKRLRRITPKPASDNCRTLSDKTSDQRRVEKRRVEKSIKDTPLSAGADDPALSETGSSRTKPKSRKRNEYSAEFEAWWGIYPRKDDKKDAAKQFPATVEELTKDRKESPQAVCEWLCSKTKDFAGSVSQTERQYIAKPRNWLRAGSYNNDFPQSNGSTNAKRTTAVGPGQKFDPNANAAGGF